MSIYNTDNRTFIIETKNTQYVICVSEDKQLYNLHFGKKCAHSDFSVSIYSDPNSNHTSEDLACNEYTPFGGTMYRDCAFKCEYSDKTRDCVLTYYGFYIKDNTLCITLCDEKYDLKIDLFYVTYDDCDIISRYAVFNNISNSKIMIDRAFSAEFTLPSRRPYTVYNSNGTWGGEQQIKKQRLECGSIQFESRKGISGHTNTPSFILAQDESETCGEIYFGTLEYSGNFKVSINRDAFNRTRAIIGINDFDFSYSLCGGEQFKTPAVHFGYANSLSQMSNNMNDFALKYVFPENFREAPLPVLYNSWEATEFDVTIDGQKDLAKLAADIGVELFVMDDGWFGKRNNDQAGLGDWTVNPQKFPNGLSELIDYVNSLGMDFGLWFEPEMVNPDSDLYRSHPDWTYHYDTREPNELRNQLVLNLTKDEVREFVFSSVDKILSENNIKYVKWDMNRPFSEIGTDNLENGKMLWYLHTEALYNIIDKLKAKHPTTQFEACASGGGRCDYGAFRHFDEIWTSDNTDAIDRIYIQNGYSLLNPTKAMRAWVTDLKWHNPAPIDFRFNIAMQGSLGIGTNLTKCTEEELEKSKENIALYKKIRNTVQFGYKYRLMNLDDDELNANQYVSRDLEKSVVFIATPSTRFIHKYFTVKLMGLEENSTYCVSFNGNSVILSGSYLMNQGIEREISGQYISEIWEISKV